MRRLPASYDLLFADLRERYDPIETRVKDLLSRMTLDEKLGQLNMPCGYRDELFVDKLRGSKEKAIEEGTLSVPSDPAEVAAKKEGVGGSRWVPTRLSKTSVRAAAISRWPTGSCPFRRPRWPAT